MKTFPTLYKKASTGKLWSWTVSVDGATIHETWGAIGETQLTADDTVRAGKNLGRANATTPETQAMLEATAKWNKKLEGHNYNESREAAGRGEASAVVEGGILPMLAHKYSERGDSIVFPAYAQPKLDGHRMTSQTDEGETTLWTRTRKRMFSVPHIVVAIARVWKRSGMSPFPLDGEGYNHDYHDKFEQLTHFLRQVKYVPGSEVVQYHIYDAAMEGVPFRERHEALCRLLDGEPADSPLKLVETARVNDEDELMLAFEKFRSQGFEGAMVRNADGAYVGKRSVDLQKVKEFDDAEFKVVGVTEGRGKLAGHAIFVCRTDRGTEFEAKMKGDQSRLKKLWDNPELCVGRRVTVQYQGLTTKNKVPRFPVAVRLAEGL